MSPSPDKTVPEAPAAYLFDMDGTLVDSERANVESVVLACRRLGVELSDDVRLLIVGHSWNEIYARISATTGIDVGMDALIASYAVSTTEAQPDFTKLASLAQHFFAELPVSLLLQQQICLYRVDKGARNLVKIDPRDPDWFRKMIL